MRIALLLCSLFVASHAVTIWSDLFNYGYNTSPIGPWTIETVDPGIDVWDDEYDMADMGITCPGGSPPCLQLTAYENEGDGGSVTLYKTFGFKYTRYSSLSLSIQIKLDGFETTTEFKIGYKCIGSSMTDFRWKSYKSSTADGTHALAVAMSECGTSTTDVTIRMEASNLEWETPDILTVVGITNLNLMGTVYVPPTEIPTDAPSFVPTFSPSFTTVAPSNVPSDSPSANPSEMPSNAPTTPPSVNCKSCREACEDDKKNCQLIEPKLKCSDEFHACRELCDFNCGKL